MTRLEHPETISYEQVKQTITQIPNPFDQSLAALAYATGSRVSEINKIKKKDLFKEETGKYLFIYCVVLKKRSATKQTRKAIVRMDETWLVMPILNRAETLKDEDYLFNNNRMFIYRHLIKHTGWNPHGFRKLRATHLRKYFNFDAYQLKDFFDWASPASSGYYIKLNNEELLY